MARSKKRETKYTLTWDSPTYPGTRVIEYATLEATVAKAKFLTDQGFTNVKVT